MPVDIVRKLCRWYSEIIYKNEANGEYEVRGSMTVSTQTMRRQTSTMMNSHDRRISGSTAASERHGEGGKTKVPVKEGKSGNGAGLEGGDVAAGEGASQRENERKPVPAMIGFDSFSQGCLLAC